MGSRTWRWAMLLLSGCARSLPSADHDLALPPIFDAAMPTVDATGIGTDADMLFVPRDVTVVYRVKRIGSGGEATLVKAVLRVGTTNYGEPAGNLPPDSGYQDFRWTWTGNPTTEAAW